MCMSQFLYIHVHVDGRNLNLSRTSTQYDRVLANNALHGQVGYFSVNSQQYCPGDLRSSWQQGIPPLLSNALRHTPLKEGEEGVAAAAGVATPLATVTIITNSSSSSS